MLKPPSQVTYSNSTMHFPLINLTQFYENKKIHDFEHCQASELNVAFIPEVNKQCLNVALASH